MALSSVINPEVITGKKKPNLLRAQNFISGGSSVGAGVLGSAANKIVNFQRAGVQPSPVDISSIVKSISTGVGGSSVGAGVLGSAANKIVNLQRKGVQPSPVDVSSIVNSISTRVVSNFNNQAQTINNSVINVISKSIGNFSKDYQNRIKKVDEANTNVISKSIGNFSKDYQDRIKKVDEAKPTGILQKILGLYRDVIGFIQFFGKRKFVEGLRDNLKALQKSFTDSFEVAKLIRQVIIKIVKQLSNLPKASPSGGGGINLDVDVPGGGLKKTAPRGLNRRMRGGKMLALGAGALGLGAAGAAATNALSGSDAVQPGSPAPEIPGNLLDGLTAVIDRFSKAIDSLVKGSSGKKTSGSSGGGGGSTGKIEKPKATPGGPPGGPGAAVLPQQGTPEEFRIAAALASEGGSGVDATDILQVAANRIASGKYGKTYTDVFAQPDQFEGVFSRGLSKYKNIKTKEDAAKFLGVGTSEIDQRLAAIRDPKLRAQSAELVQGALEFRAAPQYYQKEGLVKGEMDTSGRFYNSKWRGTAGSNQFLTGPKDPKISGPAQIELSTSQPSAQAAPSAQAQVAQRVSTVSQPAQQKPQVNYLPIDMSGGGEQQAQQSPGGGGISAPSPTPQSGPSVPFLSATNTDNFLVLYSRMVYNIVDG